MQSTDCNNEFWTIAKLKDELFKCLSKIPDENMFYLDRKYYSLAKQLMYRIQVYRPSPPFVINISDLTPRVRKELEEFIDANNEKEVYFLLKEIATKFFENIDHDYTHSSVQPRLKVRLEN